MGAIFKFSISGLGFGWFRMFFFFCFFFFGGGGVFRVSNVITWRSSGWLFGFNFLGFYIL